MLVVVAPTATVRRVTSEGTYSERHLDPALARAYREKFRGSLLRRLSHRRERRIVLQALEDALAMLPTRTTPGPGRPALLDFPCGAGRFAPWFARAVGRRSGVYHAADHSPHMLALCGDQLQQEGLAAGSFTQGDARQMPFADGAFELACCIRLVHHFRDPQDRQRILREFRRVAPGPLVLTFLDADSAKQRRHQQRCERQGVENRRAIQSVSMLRREAAEAGYDVGAVRSLSDRFSGQSVALLTPRR